MHIENLLVFCKCFMGFLSEKTPLCVCQQNNIKLSELITVHATAYESCPLQLEHLVLSYVFTAEEKTFQCNRTCSYTGKKIH